MSSNVINDYSPEESTQTLGGKRPWGSIKSAEYGDDAGGVISGAALTALPGRATANEDNIAALQAADTALGVRIDDLTTELGEYVKFDDDGNLTFPAGMNMQTSIPQPDNPPGTPTPPLIRTVIDTDSNGNLLLGHLDGQVNINAGQRPTVTIGGGAPDGVVTLTDLTPLATIAEIDEQMAYKADLIGGVIPAAQMPPGAIPNNFTVTNEADLVTLTTAIPNDRAKVTATDEIWLLWKSPATDADSWENITALGSGSGAGGGGVVSVNGLTGAVTLDLPQLPEVQNAIDDKANAADLASYAPLNSPALTGTPTAPTPPANAAGGEIMTAAGLKTALTSNLGSAAPAMDGTANAGSATTVARSDHVHPTDTSRIAVADLSTANPLPSISTASPGTSTKVAREDHVHPITMGSINYDNPILLTRAPSSVFPSVSTSNSPALRTGTPITIDRDGFLTLIGTCIGDIANAGIYWSFNVNGLRASLSWVMSINGNIATSFPFLPVSSGDVFTISLYNQSTGQKFNFLDTELILYPYL